MTLQVTDIQVQPRIDLGGTVVHSGRARVGREGMAMVKRGAPAEPFSFWVPDASPLPRGAAEPEAIAVEIWLMQGQAANTGNLIGVEQVAAAFEPDPREAGSRWLLVSGTAHAGFPITIGYRVTLVGAAAG